MVLCRHPKTNKEEAAAREERKRARKKKRKKEQRKKKNSVNNRGVSFAYRFGPSGSRRDGYGY